MIVPQIEPIKPFQLRFVGHGEEEVRLHPFFRAEKALRSNTNHRIRLLVDVDLDADHFRVAIEIILPCRPGQNRYRGGAGMIIILPVQ